MEKRLAPVQVVHVRPGARVLCRRGAAWKPQPLERSLLRSGHLWKAGSRDVLFVHVACASASPAAAGSIFA